MIDPLSADFLGGALAGIGTGGALVYWLIARGRALAMRHQPRPAWGAQAIPLNPMTLYSVNKDAPMGGVFTEQARPIIDTQACESPVRFADTVDFPVDMDGDIKHFVIPSRSLRHFICLFRPVRARAQPDGSWTAGYRGDKAVYSQILTVARAYGWVIAAGRGGVEWSPEWVSFRRRVSLLAERYRVNLPPPSADEQVPIPERAG